MIIFLLITCYESIIIQYIDFKLNRILYTQPCSIILSIRVCPYYLTVTDLLHLFSKMKSNLELLMSLMIITLAVLLVRIEGTDEAANLTGSISGIAIANSFLLIIKIIYMYRIPNHKSTLLHFVFLDYFQARQPGECNNDDNVYGSHASLEAAQVACFNDTFCIAVQDGRTCFGASCIGAFNLCKRGIRSGTSSYIYEKKDIIFHGKYVIILGADDLICVFEDNLCIIFNFTLQTLKGLHVLILLCI